MTFNEANTVEAFVRDLLCGGIRHHTAVGPGIARRSGQVSGLGWHYLSTESLPRQPQEVLVEEHLRDGLIRLNPTIAAQPDRADDVLYRLRAIIMGVRSDGLVKANEEFAAWITGEKSMPFGENGEHVTINLIDLDDLEQNQYVVTQQYTFCAGKTEKRADLVLLINGMPLVLIEAKTPVRSSQSWLDGALQVHDDYEKNVPELFVSNVFSVATEGKEYRYGSIRISVCSSYLYRIHDFPQGSSCQDRECETPVRPGKATSSQKEVRLSSAATLQCFLLARSALAQSGCCRHLGRQKAMSLSRSEHTPRQCHSKTPASSDISRLPA